LCDYTNEVRQVLLGSLTLSKEKCEHLEQEMAFTFENPEKHTWREGYVIACCFCKQTISYYIVIEEEYLPSGQNHQKTVWMSAFLLIWHSSYSAILSKIQSYRLLIRPLHRLIVHQAKIISLSNSHIENLITTRYAGPYCAIKDQQGNHSVIIPTSQWAKSPKKNV